MSHPDSDSKGFWSSPLLDVLFREDEVSLVVGEILEQGHLAPRGLSARSNVSKTLSDRGTRLP